MNECRNEAMREQLPMLLRERLSSVDTAVLRAHVSQCRACAAELRLLERSARLFELATPRIDTAAIVAKLPTAPSSRPVLAVSRSASRPFGLRRYALAAAASLVLVATFSLGVLREAFVEPSSGRDTGLGSDAPMVAAVPVGLVGGNELGELGEQDLETLLVELDRLEATVAAEPVTMQRPVSAATEEM